MLKLLLVCGFAMLSAKAATYSLKADWSDSANPNGVWSYKDGAFLLPHFASWGPGAFAGTQPAWAPGAVTNPVLPVWFKSVAPWNADGPVDWQIGDVIIHSTDGNGTAGPGIVAWTAPSNRVVNISGSAWLARKIYGRSNRWRIYRNAQLLSEGVVTSVDSYTRSNPFLFRDGSGGVSALTSVMVQAGDVIMLEISRVGASGEFTGVDLVIEDQTPTSPLTVNCTPAQGPSLVGTPYSSLCAAAGGTPPYSWSTQGPLPIGVTLSSTTGLSVTIGGTPTNHGPYSYGVTVTDSGSPAAQTAQQSFSGVVAACMYSLSPPSASLPSTGGASSVTVAATAGCSWSASGAEPWITFSGPASGTGNGSLSFTVAPNGNGQPRSSLLTIAGQTFVISQAGRGCTAALAATSAAVDAAARTYTAGLTMSFPDCPWTASSGVPWATVPVFAGNGSRAVSYMVIANPSPNSRSGSLTIAGLPFTVQQAGTDCSGITVGQAIQAFSAAGGGGTVVVSASLGCGYSVSNGASFVTVTSPLTSSGPGEVVFTVQPNTGITARTGTLTIAGQSFTITQAGVASPSISCAMLDVATIPSLRSVGRTELISDLDVLCSGRSGGNVFNADIVLAFDGSFTSRLTQASNETTEATLAVAGGGSIAGRVQGPNVVRFPGVPFSSGEQEISLRFKISKVRVDTILFGTSPQGIPVKAKISVLAPVQVPVVNNGVTVGLVFDSHLFSRGATREGLLTTQRIVPVAFQERFAAAFKTRDGEAGGVAADTGTRLRLRITGVPLNTQIFAPVSSAGGEARLFSASSDGTGGSMLTGLPRAGGTYFQLQPLAGAVTAVWEVMSTNPQAIESLDFPILIEDANAADIELIKVEGTLAPVSDVVIASGTAPIPRFVDAGRPISLVNLRVSTRAPARATVGSSVTFSYKVKNDSDLTADGVVVRNPVSDGFANPQCGQNPGVTCTVSDSGLRMDLGSLPPGAETTVTSTFAVSGVGSCPNCGTGGGGTGGTGGGGSGTGGVANCPNCLGNGSILLNSATVSGSQSDPDLGNNTSQTPIVIEEPCTFGLSRSLVTVAAAGGGVQLDVFTGPACDWSTNPPAGIMATPAGMLRGSATVTLSVPANTTAAERRSTVLVAGGQTVTIVQPAQGCTITLSSMSSSIGAVGGSSSLQIATGAACTWTATSLADWLRFATPLPAGTGSASLPFTIQPNTSIITRTATIEVAGQVLRVSQAAVGTTLPPGPQTSGMRFVPLTPCRLMETRAEYNFQGRTGVFGPPYLRAGETRTLTMANSTVCQVPTEARAYVLNVTLVPRGAVDFVTVWPSGEARPDVWTVRSLDGQVIANSAIVRAGSGGISVYASNDADVLIDIAGYFTDAAATGTNLTYFPLTPCRVIDTRIQYRSPAGPFGPPTMNAKETRSFRVPATPYCQIPAGAAAYSVSITVVPMQPLQFLTAWPTGLPQPNVSSMNSVAARTLANNVILPASTDGSVSVYVFDPSDVLVDINGYFAPDNGLGLFYTPVTQCRVSDSRLTNVPLGGPIFDSETARTIPILSSPCAAAIPGTAKAYSINATVLPGGSAMPFLTLWPSGQQRPNASVLNAFEGQTATNFSIVPSGVAGSIDAFAFRRTHLVLEISGYFGR